MSASALTVAGVSKHFGSTVAVDDVSFELGEHELLALVGPSGCGKSTLLRVLGGIHPADSGRVELAGAVVDDGRRSLPPEQRRIGLVFQDHALFPHLTVAGNVGFGIRDPKDRPARTAEMLQLVGLTGYDKRYPHELSGGERQRIALARALALRTGAPAARRTVRQPRPEPADTDPRRSRRHPPIHRHPRPVRHPRPARSARHRRPHRGDAQRPHRAARSPAHGVPPTRQPIRRQLHGRRRLPRATRCPGLRRHRTRHARPRRTPPPHGAPERHLLHDRRRLAPRPSTSPRSSTPSSAAPPGATRCDSRQAPRSARCDRTSNPSKSAPRSRRASSENTAPSSSRRESAISTERFEQRW